MKTKKYYFYALTSSINPSEIRYIGVTSTSIAQRFRLHKYCAIHPEKCGLPVHKWMSSVYKKGGTINTQQIDECEETEWEDREISLIQKYQDLGFRLLNIDKGGKGVITAEKRSKSSRERSGEAHRKAVVAFHLDGTFYKEFDSLTNAAKEVGLNNLESIGNALYGTNKSAGGYLWRHKADYKGGNIEPYSTNYSSTTIYQFNEKGELLNSFKSKIDVVNTYSGSYNGLDAAIKKHKEYKGFYWNDAPELNSIKNPYKYKISNNTEIKQFKMQKEIEEYLNMPKKSVTNRFKRNPEGFYYNNYFIERI